MGALLQEFYKLVGLTPQCYPIKKVGTAPAMILQARFALYMDRQSLDKWHPELHTRVDMEDYMAKHNNDFNLIEYRLTDEELEAFESWVEREKISTVSALNYCGEKDIKVSLTFTENRMAWCVSLTGREGNRFNSATTLTSWSEDAIEALLMGVFKASIIFQDGKWQTRKSSSRG